MKLIKYIIVTTIISSLSLLAAPTKKLTNILNDVNIRDIPSHVTLPQQAINGKFVSVNKNAFKENIFQISLPGNKLVHAINKKTKNYSNGSKVWRGEIEGRSNSVAIFTQHGNAFAGVIKVDGKVYKLLPIEDNMNTVIEVSPHEPWPEIEPIKSPDSSLPISQVTSNSPEMVSDPLPPSDDGSVIDVMVVYSLDTKTKYGGVDGINAYIATAIAESNQAYDNSEINTQLNLVYTAEVDNSSANMSTDLSELTDTSDGSLDEVHTWRDTYKADLVSYFIENSAACGLAWLNRGDLSYDAAYGFSVVASDCAVGYYSFVHELGHNMGSGHDPDNAANTANGDSYTCGVFDYSCGYLDPSETFRTVMSYNCSGGCDRYPYFSNPNVYINGLTTGVTDVMDNAKSINNILADVAGWRTSQSGPEEYEENAVIMFPSDDVEEYGGTIYTSFGYLSVGLTDVGLRFRDVNLPHGATITAAYLQLSAADPSGYDSTASTIVNIEGEDTGNAEIFNTTNFNISNRTRTSNNMTWDIPAWNTMDILHNSPDISNILQEIIDRTDWNTNNSMVLILNSSSTGNKRLAKAWETLNSGIKLHTEYTYDCVKDLILPQNQWSMISMACDPGNKTVSDLFSNLPSDEYDTTWALYERNATANVYRLVPLNEIPIEGIGYWFYTDQSGVSLSMKGKNNINSDIPLVANASGRLNLVGNTLPQSFGWADIQVVDREGTPRTLDYADINNMISRTIYKWNGSAYQTYDGVTPGSEGTLEAFDAIWVKVYNALSLRINSGSAADVTTQIKGSKLAFDEDIDPVISEEDEDPSKNDWFVRLIVESESLKDPGNILGQLHDSVDEQDRHDLEEKEPFGNPYLTIVFPHEEFEGGDWGFTTDFHELKNKKDQWKFIVKASDNIKEGILSWQGPQNILERGVIIDQETGKQIKLKRKNNYRFDIKNGEHEFTFELRKK